MIPPIISPPSSLPHVPPLSCFLYLLCPCLLPVCSSPVEFRDFDFPSKILGLLSPWTADLTYAGDSKEAKKEKKSHISKSPSKSCFHNHIHVMPLCLIPPPNS
ncbi:hypothetical protein BDV38DRAFT_14952 [Aspergillus pseudotamarii]|uniref:Uncharacterized protein n=1 Tax=Aspergillus pseudotamarii TaxID=132259 RepID=A0A5N6SDA0_ASPPS|nr:uncharacterized protein BDV38DRAFT_14952 [Aspergillus pseudotamarii]KAE8131651.1 hypothetical protein BDV38DRAFT_14952 [Aspergillus pseudotamarii]